MLGNDWAVDPGMDDWGTRWFCFYPEAQGPQMGALIPKFVRVPSQPVLRVWKSIFPLCFHDIPALSRPSFPVWGYHALTMWLSQVPPLVPCIHQSHQTRISFLSHGSH